jgi:hypothetical protein
MLSIGVFTSFEPAFGRAFCFVLILKVPSRLATKGNMFY